MVVKVKTALQGVVKNIIQNCHADTYETIYQLYWKCKHVHNMLFYAQLKHSQTSTRSHAKHTAESLSKVFSHTPLKKPVTWRTAKFSHILVKCAHIQYCKCSSYIHMKQNCFSADPICNSTMWTAIWLTMHKYLIQPHSQNTELPL